MTLATAAGALGAAPALGQIEYDVTFIEIPADALDITPRAINESGEVVGYVRFGFLEYQAFRWNADDGTIVLDLPAGATNAFGLDVNDAGVIAGGDEFGEAWTFADGAYTMLGILPEAEYSWAWGINEAGDAVGSSDGNIGNENAFFYDASEGEMIKIADGRARAINDAGQVTGWTGLTAFRWSMADGLELLGPLDESFDATFGYDINDLGEMCGIASDTPANTDVAFLYTEDTGLMMIGTPSETEVAWALNNQTQVVGRTVFEGAFVWTQQEGLRTLTGLIDPALNAQVQYAYDINDAGQIIGLAALLDDPNADLVPVVLTPMSACEADFNGDGSLDILDFVAFQNAFTSGEASADCDESGSLNILDFVCFQNVFSTGCP